MNISRRRLAPADVAWIILWVFVLTCNLMLEEKMSEAMDRYLASRYRWAVEAWLAAFYLHLSNRVAPRYDPIHLVYIGAGRALVLASRASRF